VITNRHRVPFASTAMDNIRGANFFLLMLAPGNNVERGEMVFG